MCGSYMHDCFNCVVLNGNLMSNRWIFQAAVALCFVILKVQCSGVFEISLLKLNNNRGVTHNGRCCKGPSTYSPCSGECDTFVTVCLMHYVQSMPTPRGCTYGYAVTSLYGRNNVRDQEDTIKIPIEFTWPENITLIVEAWHAVNGKLTITDSTQLIIQSFISTTLKPSLDWSVDTTITPTTELQVRYRMVCNRHYYGSGCVVLCQPRDDHFGHFSCSENGTRLCLSGWVGDYCDEPFCSKECLENKGICDRPNECRCRLGWQGKTCGECKPYPGCLHGYCHQPYQCICENGWGGILCDVDRHYCLKMNPCMNGGTCIFDHVGNYTCNCSPGFGGENCQNPLCFEDFCKNGGVCQTRAGVRECQCAEKFYGNQCETEILSCQEIRCLNGGTCVSGHLGGYCTCSKTFTGDRCETRISRCSSNPCPNGAECRNTKDSGSGFRCICPVGYGGVDCSIKINPCASIECLNGGSCKVSSVSHKPVCACSEGFSGQFCETSSDPCAGVHCLNSGKCKPSPMGNGFICYCERGYHGEVCEMEMNPCESSPCKHGGVCKSYISHFLCICPESFTGEHCELSKVEANSILSTQNDENRETVGDETYKKDETFVNVSTFLTYEGTTLFLSFVVIVMTF